MRTVKPRILGAFFVDMIADLERLITLQRLDSTAHDAQRRLAEEPARRQELDDLLETARQHVAAAKEGLAENQNTRRAVEKELSVHQGRLSKYRDQLMSVKTNVEYQAVQKEIGFAQSEVKALEDQMLERMLESDDLAEAVARAERELADRQKKVDEGLRALTTELTAVNASLERIKDERSAVARLVGPQPLAIFETVARRRNGVALAEARDGICTICHVRLRPQVFNTVLRNDQIVQCDSCQRVLYFVAPAPSEGVTQPTA